METNNDSNIGYGTLPTGTTPQSNGISQFIVDEDGMVDFRNVQRAISLQTSTVIVTGYTEAYIQLSNLPVRTVVRCTDNYRGQSWYDFVMVKK